MGVKPKMAGCKLRCGINWQGTLKHKGVRQTSTKEGLGVHNKVSCFRSYILNSDNSTHTHTHTY
jgi:hypothetical protein